MPFGSDVVYAGWVHVPEPPVGGDVGLLDGDADVGLAEGCGECEAWLWVADSTGLADLAPGPDFGMTATCGLAAIAGSRAADALLAPLRPAAPAAELAAAAVVLA